MKDTADLIARLLMAQLFLPAGIGKIFSYQGTQGYMESMGVPGALLPLVILVEVVAPALMIIGWQVRWAALALAGFALLTALLFHTDFSQQMQVIQFTKNLAIAGGLILLAAAEPGRFGVDGRRRMA